MDLEPQRQIMASVEPNLDSLRAVADELIVARLFADAEDLAEKEAR
jgi:hypothetical protein